MERVFIVPGEPRGKGRPRFSGKRAYTDEKTTAYEEKIAAYYKKAFGGHRAPDMAFLRICVIANMGIPSSASKRDKQAMAAHKIFPSRKPDVDNIAKVVLDALNNVAYKDDSRVHFVSCVKFYSFEPRLEIYIEEV